MATRVKRDVEQAQEAFNALTNAETFEEALKAWGNFLTHWYRALNRCDAEGARASRKTYISSQARVLKNEALTYLWKARNAEEHGLSEITAVQKRAFALAAFGGYEEEVCPPGPNDEQVIKFTPLSDNPPPFFAVLPEHIKLMPIADRTGGTPVPKGYDYDFGETSAPVALAAFGMEFLRQEISNLAKVQ